jgi:hypothetical protein
MAKLTTVGPLVVWNFKGWNVAEATETGEIGNVLIMDLPSKTVAVALAEAHAAGRIDLAAHAYFDHDAHVAGSRSWGGYAAIYQHHSSCSCGWRQETESKAAGRVDRADHLLDISKGETT